MCQQNGNILIGLIVPTTLTTSLNILAKGISFFFEKCGKKIENVNFTCYNYKNKPGYALSL
jgi:hypothetical protein